MLQVFELMQALLHGARSMPMDENTVSMLVTLMGVLGGALLTGYYKQLKAKAVKADRKPPQGPRKPD